MTATRDPLGLKRCATCGNAFDYERRADGRCGQCGGDFDTFGEVEDVDGDGDGRPRYVLVRDADPGDAEPLRWREIEQLDRDDDGLGAILAVNRAHWHSTRGGPVTVLIGGRVLCRYADGRRA